MLAAPSAPGAYGLTVSGGDGGGAAGPIIGVVIGVLALAALLWLGRRRGWFKGLKMPSRTVPMTRTVSMEAPLSSNAMVPGSYAPPNLEPLPLPPPATGSAPPADSQSAIN